MANLLILLVPRAGIVPARDNVPRDFKSLASTKFRHPGEEAVSKRCLRPGCVVVPRLEMLSHGPVRCFLCVFHS